MKRSHWGWMLACILSFTALSFGQVAATSMRGVVKDPTGALVPGAKITLLDKATGQTLAATSTATGYYELVQIPPAKYTITITATGFADKTELAELLVNQPATIDFTLTIQASTETVDVSSTAQTLNTTDATMGDSVGNDMIQALPMSGRDPISLLSLQPGVLFLGQTVELGDKTAPQLMDSRQGAVSGARSDQGNVTLDGVDDNDQVNGYAFNGVLRSTLDSTEEFRVTTSNSNADAGRSSGAQVSLITKSGTNKFHGAVYEYNRPTNTVANDWFIKEQELSSGEPNVPTKYIVNTFGGSIGGPIIKDKLFFFYNYEGQRLATDDPIAVTTPSATFLAGQLGYFDAAGNSHLLSPAQIATLDAKCTQCSKPGVDPAILSYLSTEPVATVLAGGDGINNGSFNFGSPAPQRLNTNIGKIDYTPNSKQHIFVRGNLQKDFQAGDQNLPGQPPSSILEDNTKGLAAGDTYTLSSNLVNDLRYAYIRQGYSTIGIGQGDYVSVRFLQQPTAQTRSSIVSVPLNTIDDNLSWTKGTHTLSFGGNWRLVDHNSVSNAASFNGATTNPSYLSQHNVPDPTTLGLPAVSVGFATEFDQAYATIVGDVAERTSSNNYVASPTSATLLADGSFVNRHFRANEFEYFAQDSWRLKPNLTLTFGLRHTILQTPYETAGQEVTPTTDTHEWYLKRGQAAAQGLVYEPDLLFSTAGKFYHKPGFWPKQKDNFAPRLSVVYSPDGKTSIRSGFGIYFDHFGEALTTRFSNLGSFGISSQYQSAANLTNFETAPRFTGPHNLPNLPLPAAPALQKFPYDVPDGTFGINWGIDNHVHTPYVEAFNLSVQRELPGGFLLDTAYVGRLGRHLFQQLDIAEPVDLNDPKGAGDYFSAGQKLSRLSDLNGGNANAKVPAIQYFEDVFPQLKNTDYAGESATQAIYSDEWAPQRYIYGETGALYDIDLACDYGCPNGTEFWNTQFASLISLASIGMSYYNAAQVTLRHPARYGLTADFSYTYSRSIDMGSDAERSATSYGGIQNSWKPSLSRGLSDFDATHLITGDWAYALPFGTGKMLLANSSRVGNAVWGGWQFAGLGRWTSGLPFALIEPGWSTDWESQAWSVQTQPVQVHKHIEGGLPQVFANDQSIQNGIYTGNPIRLPYPGEAGDRNHFRGDGVFDVDSSLSKNWNLTERTNLKFAWEVFNAPNSVRFDDGLASSFGNALGYPGFGFYGNVLGRRTFRHMEFGLRLEF